MKMRLAVPAVLVLSAAVHAEYHFEVTLKGATTVFTGESGLPPNTINGLEFTYQLTAPYDAATGQITGRRRHSPVVFTEQWGATTPQLLSALATNESIKTAVFTFYRSEAGGREIPYMRITLQNAAVVNVAMHGKEVDPSTWQGNPPPDTIYSDHELADVTLIFRKIQIEHADSRNTFNDDWTSTLGFLLPNEIREEWDKAFTRWTTTDVSTDDAVELPRALSGTSARQATAAK